ncbi:MAG: hypothetical protein IPN69_18160 [Acidobacteria bacterium]|nr:hypothetical protein [Acidobacteriota bacterium]
MSGPRRTGSQAEGFARKAPGRANKRQAANRKKRKTTGSEDDLEWTKALSSTPRIGGSAGGVSGRRAVPAGLVEPEEGYGNAAHVEIEEKQKRFPSIPTIAWKSQKAAFHIPHSHGCWV